MDKEMLLRIINDTRREGKIPDLRCANLEGMNLSGLDLYGVNFQGANLDYCCLSFTDMCNTNLRDATLRYANLYGANLTRAVVYETDFRYTYLDEANLHDVELLLADLRFASGNFSVFSGGLHYAVAAANYVMIGCMKMTIDWWQENYRQVGMDNHYTTEEIERYGAWLMTLDWLKDK